MTALALPAKCGGRTARGDAVDGTVSVRATRSAARAARVKNPSWASSHVIAVPKNPHPAWPRNWRRVLPQGKRMSRGLRGLGNVMGTPLRRQRPFPLAPVHGGEGGGEGP